MLLNGKILIAQGGGPSAVINQSLVGAILEARKFQQVDRVYGALHGVNGIINENFLDLTQETTLNLENVARTPSSALGSTRDKPDEAYCKEMFEVMRAHDIRFFFYIGGNDSASTVKIVNDHADKSGYEFRAIHIPKTIDNDLLVNDHTPGFGSAAKFVYNAFKGIDLDNRSLKGVYIGVTMGRDAGFLAGAAGLARKFPDDGPHLIYLPEMPFSEEQFVKDVKGVYDRLGRCIICVSEGICTADGKSVVESLTKNIEYDSHGNASLSTSAGALGESLAKLVKEKLHIGRVRADSFGYLQRSFLQCVSDTDQNEAREVGEKAAQFAIWGDNDGSVTIHRTGNYTVDYRLTPLDQVAKYTKSMAPEFINPENNNVTNAYIEYLRPLVGGGLEENYLLRAPSVNRILIK